MADPIPLYVSDLDTLLQAIRIDTASEKTLNEVYRAVRDVRIGIVQQLGRSRAFEIRDLPYVENPETDDEILRETAVSVETLWLRVLLIQRLPNTFMDNKASTGDVFNDEPLTRDAASTIDFINSLKKQLADLLVCLADENSNASYPDKVALNGNPTPYIIGENLVGNGCL